MVSKNLLGQHVQCHIDKGDPESFVLGKLLYADDRWFLMNDVTPYGEYNGFALYSTEDLVFVEENTEYIRMIMRLLEHNHALSEDVLIQDDDPLTFVLKLAKTSAKVIGIEVYASGIRDINGIVEDIGENSVVIKQIDEFGRCDGRSWIKLGAVTRVFWDDKESMCLQVLYNN